jgi:hypothetical protein
MILPPPVTGPDWPIGRFFVLSADRWYAHLQARGVALDGPPTRSEHFNVYGFFARDPNDYRIEFQTFLDPSWPA